MGDDCKYSKVNLTPDIEQNHPLVVNKANINMPDHDPERGTKDLDNHKHKVRKWEVFPGRNKFCCDGRIMLSTQTGIFYFTLFLIIATSACFFGNDAPFLWKEVHPVLPVLAGVQLVFVIVVLCRTAFGDPGVIPRASPAEAQALEKLIEQEQAAAQEQSKTSSVPYRPPPRVRDVTVNGRTFKLKYCYTCKIFRPPRASHCSVCDNCVDRFDHHCPWVGNCVGRRNYKYFFLFLSSLTVYCGYLMALSVTSIVKRSQASSFAIAMQQGPLSPIVALVAFFSIWSVAGLAGFHAYLSGLNMTTNEDIKGTFKESNGGNPFSKGSCWGNCAVVLCGPLPPSLIDRRGWVSEADIPPVTNPPDRAGTRNSSSVIRDSPNVTLAPTNTNSSNRNQNAASHSSNHGAGQYSETGSLNNGKGYPVQASNPPRKLPPLDHYSNGAEKSHNREYLT